MKRERRVLVVEDNPLIANAIEAAGESLDLKTDRATDGWEAIELLETEEYAAIVIDTDLPRHSGFGVLTYLREEVGDHLGNVILMTSSDRDTLRQKFVDDNVQVIEKTGEVEALARIVRIACGQE